MFWAQENRFLKAPFFGLFQAAGVAVYCFLISEFFYLMSNFSTIPEETVMIPIIMLCLLVFSVALMGLVVFGYPVYLAINKEVKKALAVLGYTFLYCFIFLAVLIKLAVFAI